jgi:hypothetical protein
MVTYFNLHLPDSERLMGDSEIKIEREHKACPILLFSLAPIADAQPHDDVSFMAPH